MRSDAWRDERDSVPRSLKQAAELRREIVAAGFARSTAANVVMWLVSKETLGEDPEPDSGRRNTYRHVLRTVVGLRARPERYAPLA